MKKISLLFVSFLFMSFVFAGISRGDIKVIIVNYNTGGNPTQEQHKCELHEGQDSLPEGLSKKYLSIEDVEMFQNYVHNDSCVPLNVQNKALIVLGLFRTKRLSIVFWGDKIAAVGNDMSTMMFQKTSKNKPATLKVFLQINKNKELTTTWIREENCK